MIKSTIASIAMVSIAGTLSATASADDWDMRAYTGAEIATDSEAANSWTLSATSDQGPGLVFVCTENSGMRGAVVYEPDEDLVDQALFSRGWTANKTGNVTVGDRSMEDRWVHTTHDHGCKVYWPRWRGQRRARGTFHTLPPSTAKRPSKS